MPSEDAFLAAIAASPMDHLPKLVYADWLEEQGDSRFEYLRLQHTLAQTSVNGAEWWGVLEHRHNLATTLGAEWLKKVSAGLEWIGEIRSWNDYLQQIPLAAAAGNPTAMTSFAMQFWRGQGKKQNYGTARKWLERAVEAGDALAMYLLGVMYQDGLGMWGQYYEKAAKLFRRSSNLGYAPAMVELGKMYAAGEGVRRNMQKAVQLYRLAAEKGEAKAHLILGNRYRDGRGVPKDVIEAAKFYRKAINLGDEMARERLQQLLWKYPNLAE